MHVLGRLAFFYFFSNGYHVTSIPVSTISCVRRAYSVNGASPYIVATHAFLFPNARLTPPFSSGANRFVMKSRYESDSTNKVDFFSRMFNATSGSNCLSDPPLDTCSDCL